MTKAYGIIARAFDSRLFDLVVSGLGIYFIWLFYDKGGFGIMWQICLFMHQFVFNFIQ